MQKDVIDFLKRYGLDIEKVRNNITNDSPKDILKRLLVGESYFFRDRQVWADLKEYLLKYTDKKVNFLSLGCSRGEEVYNFCFLANELGLRYSATGIDVSAKRIEQAKQGIYDYWSIRMLNTYELNRYFVSFNEKWKVKDIYKKNVNFKVENILEFNENMKFDLIMLRRVLIYFSFDALETVFKKLRFTLSENGILILGRGEYYPQMEKFFEPMIFNKSIFWMRSRYLLNEIPDVNDQKEKISIFSKVSIKPSNIGNDKEKEPLSMKIIRKLIESEKYCEALQMIDELLEIDRTSYLVWKYKTIAELKLNNFEKAKESLKKAIFLNPDDYELWYLEQLLMR